MNDEDFKFHCARIEKAFDHWVPLLGLTNWRIDYNLVRGEIEPLNPIRDRLTGSCPVMRCQWRWEYLYGTIEVSVTQIATVDDYRLDEYVMHELCHALVQEMRHDSEEEGHLHEERAVTNISRAMQCLYETGLEDGAAPKEVPNE